ncbi:MAG: serine hydrolase [Armatimonadota bacterium]
MVALVALMAMTPQTGIPTVMEDIAVRAQSAFPGLKPTDFAISWRNLETGAEMNYNGGLSMYPASVVKMFYLAYAEELLTRKKLVRNPEFDRALADMIKESNNDATGLILDTITGTTGGPSLSDAELKKWVEKRQMVNNWLMTLGIKGINASQKTWNEGPYGRERQGYGPNFEHRNSLTADSCVQLMSLIAQKKLAGSDEMLSLLSRKAGSKDGQVEGFLGELLPADAKLWSKAGWTSTTRHDVAFVELGGQKKVYAVFTRYQVENPKLLQWLANEILKL